MLLLEFWPNNYALVAMQLFDGIGAGTFGLSLVCLTKTLTKGTGRFSFTLGFIITINMVGGALSNLIGGYIVNLSSYIWGFISLGIMGSVSVILASFINVEDRGHCGDVNEDLTITSSGDTVGRTVVTFQV